MEDALSTYTKTVLDNKKSLEEKLLSQTPNCDGFTNRLNAIFFFQTKIVMDSKLFVYASTQSNNNQRTLLWMVYS